MIGVLAALCLLPAHPAQAGIEPGRYVARGAAASVMPTTQGSCGTTDSRIVLQTATAVTRVAVDSEAMTLGESLPLRIVFRQDDRVGIWFIAGEDLPSAGWGAMVIVEGRNFLLLMTRSRYLHGRLCVDAATRVLKLE